MEDILDDPKLAECSLAECWLFVCLLASLNRMKSRDGKITIPLRSVYAVARTRDWPATRSRLDSLQNAALLRHERAGKSLYIEVPKWAETQGFTPSELHRDSGETPPPTPTPTPTPTKKEPAASAAPLAAVPPEGKEKPKKARRTAFPEPFPPDLRADLQRWAPGAGFTEAQVDVAIQTVGDWAVSNGKTKASWLRTIQGAMRAGWALNLKPGSGPPPKEEATRREYLEFDSPEWKKAYGYES